MRKTKSKGSFNIGAGVIDWAASQPTPPANVLSSLSGLVSFLPDASGEKYDLLLSPSPYAHEHHGAYDFLKELRRLVEGNPKEVCTVLRRFIETHEPMYDYEDRMRKLVARLAELGYRGEAMATALTLPNAVGDALDSTRIRSACAPAAS